MRSFSEESSEYEDFDEDVTPEIKEDWAKWRQNSEILCDKQIPLKLKGKFYRTVVRPTIFVQGNCKGKQGVNDLLYTVSILYAFLTL